VDYLGLCVLSWMSPFVMDGPADEGMAQSVGRFIFPNFGIIFVVGAFMKPHEAVSEDVVFPIWLRLILILWFVADVSWYARLKTAAATVEGGRG
jgi:hypothetical protein